SKSHELTGWFDARFSPYTPPESETDVAILDDFEFQVGGRSFGPRKPIRWQGKTPFLRVEIADNIHFDDERVHFFWIRSGGDIVEETDDEVTFRHFDFRSGDTGGGRVSGVDPESGLPQRFYLRGTVHQVDQTFHAPETCDPFIVWPPPPVVPGDGGVIIIAQPPIGPVDGGVTLTQAPADPGLVINTLTIPPALSVNRVTSGSSSTISGTLRAPGSAIMANTAGISGNRVGAVFEMVTMPGLSLVSPPSLEDLNIWAPDGADLAYDAEDGVLTIESDGDIHLDGPFPDLPGVTKIRIISGGNIVASEDFEFPSDVTLELVAERSVEIPGPPPGGPITLPLPRPCGLQATGGAVETRIGTFTMVASTSNEAVEIDVLPWHEPNRLRLGSRQLVPVALLGSDRLDVRGVDRHSLRLGPEDAQPISHFGRPLVFSIDMNRDGHRDLVAIFQLRKLGVAYGDTELCLSAETGDGDAIEGCDAIETLPGWRPKRDWPRRHSSRRADRTR
ncbi:MAG: hypothetical protein JRH19_16875, partial [Deltaproteobacteria bacterium]|nr:hypothetical protein [Deltaproteobacteria bacterium]